MLNIEFRFSKNSGELTTMTLWNKKKKEKSPVDYSIKWLLTIQNFEKKKKIFLDRDEKLSAWDISIQLTYY